MSTSMRLAPHISKCRPVFLCCDLQEKFSRAIPSFENGVFVANRMLSFAALNSDRCAYFATEQYPTGLGHTVASIPLATPPPNLNLQVFEKTKFSMLTPSLEQAIAAHIAAGGEASGEAIAVIFGIEAHVCVLQSVEDLAQRPQPTRVFVLADGTYSQRDEDRKYALKLMASMPNVTVTTSESLMFQLIRAADDPGFKGMSALARIRPPAPRSASPPKP
jgi:hypothetical protein